MRTAALATLRRAGYPESGLRDAEIVIGELLANAARHAPGTVDLLLEWDQGGPVLRLLDRGPGYPAVSTAPEPFSESGRGLYLVAALARSLEVAPRPEGGSDTRVALHPAAT